MIVSQLYPIIDRITINDIPLLSPLYTTFDVTIVFVQSPCFHSS